MALIDARIQRSIKVSESKSDKGSIKLTASQDFLIIADQKDPAFADVLENRTVWPNLGNARLPQIDDTISINGVDLFVTSRELSYYKDSERVVLMEVKYEAKAPPEQEKPEGTDPETWKRISISSQSITKPAQGWTDFADVPGLFAGFNGESAKNSAKEPIDGLEEECSLVRLSYTNTQCADPDFYQLLGHVNACNSLAFLGADTYCMRVTGVSAEYDQKNNTWSVTVEFTYNPDGWEIQFYDVGFNEIVDNERRAILDKAGNPVSSPVPLNGNGGALAIGSNPPIRVLYPYPKTNLDQLFTTCRI